MKERIACSACLLGHACKYDGGSNFDPKVVAFLQGCEVIPVCPEMLGGLSTPRIPAEIQADGTVLNRENLDVTPFFERGKTATLAILREAGCDRIILKDGSPSCGTTYVYDGSFTHRAVPGMGVCARYLRDNGIKIVDIHEKGQRLG